MQPVQSTSTLTPASSIFSKRGIRAQPRKSDRGSTTSKEDRRWIVDGLRCRSLPPRRLFREPLRKRSKSTYRRISGIEENVVPFPRWCCVLRHNQQCSPHRVRDVELRGSMSAWLRREEMPHLLTAPAVHRQSLKSKAVLRIGRSRQNVRAAFNLVSSS